MEKIAELTGGKFFRSTNEKSLETIFDNISGMEKTEVEEAHYREETDLYGGILLVGFLVFGLNLLLMITFIHNPLEG